jgi:hypothetical protein
MLTVELKLSLKINTEEGRLLKEKEIEGLLSNLDNALHNQINSDGIVPNSYEGWTEDFLFTFTQQDIPLIQYCQNCGDKMVGKNKGAKYCSGKCGVAAHRKRKSALCAEKGS